MMEEQKYRLKVKYDFPQDDIAQLIKQVEKQFQKDQTAFNNEIKKGEAISLGWRCWTGVMNAQSESSIEQVLKKYNDLYFKQLLQKNGQHFGGLNYSFDHSGDLQHEIYFKYLLGNYFKQLQNTQIKQISIQLFQSGPLGDEQNYQIFFERFGQCLRNLKGTNVSTFKIRDGDEELRMNIGHFNEHIIKNLKHEQFNKVIYETGYILRQFFDKNCGYINSQNTSNGGSIQWFQELNNTPNIKNLDLEISILLYEFQEEGKGDLQLFKDVLQSIQGLKYIEEFNLYIYDNVNDDNIKTITQDKELMEIIVQIKKIMKFNIILKDFSKKELII